MPDVRTTETPPPESRRRILFVDDDPLILRSIARTMRAAEPGWDIVMCEDPTRALELIESEPVDIVVSDLNMKKLDGAELLVEVQHARPQIVRIVLSAMVDTKQIFRAVPVAHQFITKPFDVSELRAKLRAAFELGELLKSDRLRALVAGDNALPVAPSTFAELSRAVADPRTGVAEMARIVEEDTGLSAELIRLISSAFFGLPKQVRGVRGAIAYLGVEMLKSLVLKVEIVRAFRVADVPVGFDVEGLQSHALLVARAARRLLVGNK
ncbi:MAG TPA: HDOD domain-containing protein, partial [Polyangiaceae bacterium]